MADCGDILKRLDGIEGKNTEDHKEMLDELKALGLATAIDRERIEAAQKLCDERHTIASKFMWGIGGTVVLAAAGFVVKAIIVE